MVFGLVERYNWATGNGIEVETEIETENVKTTTTTPITDDQTDSSRRKK